MTCLYSYEFLILTSYIIQILVIKATLWFISLFWSLDSDTWDDSLIDALDFLSNYVLQVPFFLMTVMRYVVPTLDNLYRQPFHA